MKENVKKKIFIIIIIAITFMMLFAMSYWVTPIIRFYGPNLEFQKGSWEMSNIEEKLEIKLSSDGSIPCGIMVYDDEEFEIELYTKASSAHFFVKGKNDSDFNFWLTGDCRIKSNGDIYIKNIECLDVPHIDFFKNRLTLKKKR